jgi:methyltransferase (TIGR00027 family)
VRVALWRAMHVAVDRPPYVLEDEIGLKLAAPEDDWRLRPDMDADRTRDFRASVVARARFIEDLLVEQSERGVAQYVILGAGLDSFAERRADFGSRLTVFEVDRAGPQAWKRQRLIELGFGVPDWLRLVPADFGSDGTWWRALAEAGFDSGRPAVLAAAGVSMYLSRDAIAAWMREAATLAPGSTLVLSFLLPLNCADPKTRPGLERAVQGARVSGTPFISFFTPADVLALARESGFRNARHVSADELTERYFANRTDGLRPPAHGEELLVATSA